MRTLNRCGLRPIAPATASIPGSTPVELLIRLLERANPSFDQDATNALAGNPSAVATLGRWGFIPKEGHHDAKLPPELLNFPILKEAPNVEAALSNPTFKESQKIVQDRPNDADALATLRQATEPVKLAYRSAIEDRVRNGSSPCCELRVGEAVEVKKSLRHIFGPPRRIVNSVTGEVFEDNKEQFHLTRGTVTSLDPVIITSDKGEDMGHPANFRRLQDPGQLAYTCRTVIMVGNRDFVGVYDNVWQLTSNSDRAGVEDYDKAVAELKSTAPKKPPRQTTAEVCELFQHAAIIKPTYDEFVKSLVQDMKV